MQLRTCLVAMMAAGSAFAHMNMNDPPPLAYKGNPNAKEPNIDYSITAPISKDQFPCKGYLKLLGTPEAAPVKTYAPGEQSTMSVEGGAAHNGGSCQLSLSYDQGKTFTVIKSFIGNCPTSSGGTFNFAIPADAPESDEVVFAWSWVNHTGNREFYMNCAIVAIKGGQKRDITQGLSNRAAAFDSRPKMFEANLGGEFCTKEGVDVVFPEPGPDVEVNSNAQGAATLCGSGSDAPMGSTDGSDSGSGSNAGSGSSPSSAPAGEPAPTSSTAASVPTPTGGVFFTVTDQPEQPTQPATTFSTLPSSAPASSPAAPSSAAPSSPAAGGGGTPTESASLPVGTGVSGTQKGSCAGQEGAWACSPDGASFQRCASGAWSAAIPMAAGTKCTPGVSENLRMSRRRDRVRRRGFNAWDW